MAFTRENAKENAIKGNIARWHTSLAEPEQVEIAAETPINPAQVAEPVAGTDYQDKRLNRVRKQLGKLDTLFRDEIDPQKLDRLASAMARLSEIERQLAGRPMPGSLRPTSKSSKPTSPKVE